ncbi:MAG: 6-carboxytetrahydropterin synthase [Deltaproteobacteria bacterium]|nr:6-carboxytetrahydropterin synthase [Deltaproteobacteria bacterium]
MFRVSEEVRFCYGHRLLDYVGRCARVHGHNARVQAVLEAPALDARGFVVDFLQVEEALRRWVDETLDHRLLLRHDDPLIPRLVEAREDFLALPFNPTAENLARMVFERLRDQGLPVVSVRFWETDTSVASYQA